MNEPEQTFGVEQEAAASEENKALPVKGEARKNQSQIEAADHADHNADAVTRAAALAVVVIGVALIEVELLAGVALGAAAIAAPQLIPLFRSAARKMMGSNGKGETARPSEAAAKA
jgi:divalent metal cation (Fe/Co/Zn/Cd) transporter